MPILSSIGGGSIRSLGRGIEQEAAVVPAGTVLMWNVADATTETVPTGWRVHTGFDGKLVLGTANTSQIGTTANASGNLSVTVNTTINGAHSGTLVVTSPGVVVSGGTFMLTGFEAGGAGGHNHLVNVLGVNTSQLFPNTSNIPFITTDNELPTLPPNSIIFRKITPTSVNYDHYRPSGDGYFCGSDQQDWIAQSSVTVPTLFDGLHQHNVVSQRVSTTSGTGTPGLLSTSTGSHAHDAFIKLTTMLKSKLLKPWVSLQEESIEPGVIVMYDSNLATLPAGWRVCNGQNGTEDMVDFFLGYNSSEIHGSVISSSNTVSISGNTSTNNWTHSHLSGQGAFSSTQRLHGEESFPHSHDIVEQQFSTSYVPPYRKVAFIQYKGI